MKKKLASINVPNHVEEQRKGQMKVGNPCGEERACSHGQKGRSEGDCFSKGKSRPRGKRGRIAT